MCDRDSLCERGSLREARGSLRERCSLRDYEYIILIICCSHKHNFAKIEKSKNYFFLISNSALKDFFIHLHLQRNSKAVTLNSGR